MSIKYYIFRFFKMAAVHHLSSKYCKSPNKRRVSIKRQVSDKRQDPNRRRIITGGYDGMYGNLLI